MGRRVALSFLVAAGRPARRCYWVDRLAALEAIELKVTCSSVLFADHGIVYESQSTGNRLGRRWAAGVGVSSDGLCPPDHGAALRTAFWLGYGSVWAGMLAMRLCS